MRSEVTRLHVQCDLPGNGRDRVNQCPHEAEEQGTLPFHKFLLEKRTLAIKEKKGKYT